MGGILGVTSKSDKRHKMMFSVLKDELMQNIEKRKTKGKDWKDMGKKMQTVRFLNNFFEFFCTDKERFSSYPEILKMFIKFCLC